MGPLTAVPLAVGHHKLIEWKIVTHGCVDGYTRMCMFLRASTNNTAPTVLKSFLEATEKYGWPSRVRADKGGENLAVGRAIEQYHGNNKKRGLFIQGKSCHNQRIERKWKDVHSDVTISYYNLFTRMGNDGILDKRSDLHIWALHIVFLPMLNLSLDAFVLMDAHTGNRMEGFMSGQQLWTEGYHNARLAGYDMYASPVNDPDFADDYDRDLLQTEGPSYEDKPLMDLAEIGQANFDGPREPDVIHHKEIPKVSIASLLSDGQYSYMRETFFLPALDEYNKKDDDQLNELITETVERAVNIELGPSIVTSMNLPNVDSGVGRYLKVLEVVRALTGVVEAE